jgi:hypothetical protein
MAESTGVRVSAPDGTDRTYLQARQVTRDGNGDYELRTADGQIVAVRRRSTVEEIEVIFAT